MTGALYWQASCSHHGAACRLGMFWFLLILGWCHIHFRRNLLTIKRFVTFGLSFISRAKRSRFIMLFLWGSRICSRRYMGRCHVGLHTSYHFLRFSTLKRDSRRLRFIFYLLMFLLKIAISLLVMFLNRRLFELWKNKSFCQYGSFRRLTARKVSLSIFLVIKALQVLGWSERRIRRTYWHTIHVRRCLGMSDDIDSSRNRSRLSAWVVWITNICYYTTLNLRCVSFLSVTYWRTVTIPDTFDCLIAKGPLVRSD